MVKVLQQLVTPEKTLLGV